jgi:hypothetical protein
VEPAGISVLDTHVLEDRAAALHDLAEVVHDPDVVLLTPKSPADVAERAALQGLAHVVCDALRRDDPLQLLLV